MTYSPTELLACVAARLLADNQSVFVGTGLPLVASMLAQKTHAPGLLLFFEAGGIGPQVPALPISVGDSRTYYKAIAASSMHDTMSLAQVGYIDVGFLGAAQIDVYGNINTTVIGRHDRPTARLPGSGGANDVASFSHRLITILRQSMRSFVEKLDFLTTPGYLTGPGAREQAGLAKDTGPYRVITQLGTYGFDDHTKRMKLLALNPGVAVQQVCENSSFEIGIPDTIPENPPPTPEEIRLLREVIDPVGIVLGKQG
jgi:glutaconate CoA-transferase subunit B